MSQSSLDAALLLYQRWRHVGEIVLICGLLGEFTIVSFLHDRERAERVCSVLFTAIVLLGVIIETVAGGRADDVVQKMRAPRALSEAQQVALADKLRGFGTHEAILYEISDVDPEISGITTDVSKSCAAAGWKAGFESFPPIPPFSFRAPDHGILIVVSPMAPDRSVLPAAQTLVSTLQADGLQARLSTAFVGASPPIDNRIAITVYGK